MMNPMQMIQMLRGSGNPQAMVMNMLKQQSGNNPMAQSMMNMVQSNNISGIEQMGRNIAKERGIDFDKAFSDFKNQFSMK